MSIFRYELAKIFRRKAVIIALVAFWLVNLYNLYNVYPPLEGYEKELLDAEIAINQEVEGALDEEKAAQMLAHFEALKNGTVKPNSSFDVEIYEAKINEMQQLYDYRDRAEVLKVNLAERLATLEGSGHTYEIRRLKLMQQVYGSRAVTGYYDAYGFALNYQKYDFSSLLAVLLLLIGVTPLFTAERECGMDVLLKTSRLGRRRTVGTKLWAAATFAVISGLVLFVTDLIYLQTIYPFDLWRAPLFSVTGYYNTPLNLTVGGFILLNWVAKLFGLCVAALVVATLSAVCRRSYFTFFFGAGYLFAMMFLGEHVMIVNPLSLLTFIDYVKDFNTVNILGFPVLTIVALPLVMLCFAAVLVAFIQFWQKRERTFRQWRLPKWLTVPTSTKNILSGGGEWRKRLIKQRLLGAIALLIVLKLILGANADTYEYFTLPSEREAYAAILERIGGETTDAAVQFFAEEDARIAADQAYEVALTEKLNKGELSPEAFAFEISTYDKQATISPAVLQQLKADYTYVAEDPTHRRLTDTRGWNQLMDPSMDMLAALLVILLSGVAFSFEWESGMANLLRTNRCGRRGLAWRKIAVSVLATAGVWVLFEGITLAFVAGRYPLFGIWNYPLQTLQSFSQNTGDLTLGQTYLLSKLLSLLGLCLVQAIAGAISAGTRRSLTAVFSAMALTIIPYYLLRNSGNLLTIPTPAGLLCGSGFFALPAWETAHWIFFPATVLGTAALVLFTVERYAGRKGGAL